MKKQLLAMAVAAAAMPLAAQADGPQVYGQLDLSVQHTESLNFKGDRTITTGDSTLITDGRFNGYNVGSQTEVRSNKSRIGVRGSSDLDAAGLSAIYQLEYQVDPTDGNVASDNNSATNGMTFSQRNSYLGVKSDSWGELFVGRYDSVVKQAEFSVDQFNNTDADMELLFNGQQRYSNTINYASPKFGPSIQVKAQLMPGESRVNFDSNGNPKHDTSIADGWGLSVGMHEGNMFGAVAYERGNQQVTYVGGPETSDINTLRVTAGLDGDLFGVGALYERVDGSSLKNTYGSSADGSRSGWLISGRYNPLQKVAVKAQFGRSDDVISGIANPGTYVGPGVVNANNDNRQIQTATIGVDYMLGKGTKVYTLYSSNTVQGNVAGLKDKSEFKVFSVGMQHKF